MATKIARITSGVVVPALFALILRLPVASGQPVPQPSVQIVVAPSSGATNQLLNFTGRVNLGLGTNQISWDFGDGATAGGMSVMHAFRNAGSYKVRLLLTISEGVVLQDMTEVTIADSVTLPPGDSITFASPF